MVSDISSTRVLVTGGSGFVGLHTVLHLLQLGYCVRTTVRAEAKEQKVRQSLSRRISTSQLEIACADLLSEAGWEEAVSGCSTVLHIASPFTSVNPRDENDLILPARDGSLRVLRAAQAEGVKRAVMLSTTGAVFDGHEGENRIFDETDWTDLSKNELVYHKSKTLAERAAWDFIGSAENQSGMELVVINPSSIMGPVLDNHYHTSIEWFRTLMHAEVPGIPRIQLNFVDVRDVAGILEKAMAAPGAAGKRFIMNAASIPLLEFAEILHETYTERGYRVPNRLLPDWLFRFIGLTMPKARFLVKQLRWEYTISTARVESVFSWQPRPYKQTILDMADSLIEYGLV